MLNFLDMYINNEINNEIYKVCNKTDGTYLFDNIFNERHKILVCDNCGIPFVRNNRMYRKFTSSTGKNLCRSCATKLGKNRHIKTEAEIQSYITEKRMNVFYTVYEPEFMNIFSKGIYAEIYDKYRFRIASILAKQGLLEDKNKTNFRYGLGIALKYVRKAVRIQASKKYDLLFSDLGFQKKRKIGLPYDDNE